MDYWTKKRTVFSGKIFSVETGTVELADGSKVDRDVVRHKGSVAIVAVLDDQIIFVSQPRQAVNKQVLEIPAGRIDGETPLCAAARELEEETGYKARKLVEGPVYYSSVGFLDEQVHVFLAFDLYKDDQQAKGVQQDDDVTIVTLSFAEARRRLEANKFEDSKTIIGLRQLLVHLKKDETPVDNRTLYDWYASENHKYNTLIWQFPAAILALNILAWEKIGGHPATLLSMFLINLVLVLCVSKHVWHQKQFTRALKKINEEFKKYPDLYVVEFKHGRFSRLPAGWILVGSMVILDFAYMVLIWRMRSA